MSDQFIAEKIWLRKLASENGFPIEDEQLGQIELFVVRILEWNQKINLISRRDEKNVWKKHVLESISILFFKSFLEGTAVIDIGTGGGFPGVPLAILQPSMKFLLVDSIQKKIRVLESVVSDLNLSNVTPLCTRVEALGRNSAYQNRFHYAICRGVGPATRVPSVR